jgi:DNA-directed RNA polymerase specialized sigma24 family protein
MTAPLTTAGGAPITNLSPRVSMFLVHSRGGDERDRSRRGRRYRSQLDEHRVALTAYCGQLLGSKLEAEDAVQETLLRAWRSGGRFEGRSSQRTWLYRIATNVCVDMLSGRARRPLPVDAWLDPNVLKQPAQMPTLPRWRCCETRCGWRSRR